MTGLLSNFDIFDICNKLKIKLDYCSFKDTMEMKKYKNYNAIINLDGVSPYDGNEAGSHWTCYIQRNNEGVYMDSFGYPQSIQTEDFIKLQGLKHYGYNITQIQDLKSDYCGYYCIGLLLYVKLNDKKSLFECVDNYINMFSHSNALLKSNDAILMKYIRNYH